MILVICDLFSGNPHPLDIGVLIGAQSGDKFVMAKEILEKMLVKYDFSSGNKKVGVILYGKEPILKLPVTKVLKKTDLLQEIKRLRHPADGFRLDKALQKAEQEFFSDCSPGTVACPNKILLLFTDRKPDEKSKVLADKFTSNDVKIVSVVLGLPDKDDVNKLGGKDTVIITPKPTDAIKDISDDIKDALSIGKVIVCFLYYLFRLYLQK